ncbi:hypothetical protein [Bradyrhizobium sp. CCBAU 11357]|uniref:hypothetical protein n=1 Tax=Bradyrhizobium sp. CCBAU 11357 TaxID=1630808 RepID=UPI00230446AE|nr:hypothetical protein [Bradyrhizobium sp. CCBAU 11357]
MIGDTCMLLCGFSACAFAQRTAGARRHPVFPAPFFFWGDGMKQSSGEMSREDAKLCLRSRREFENVADAAAEGFWIASLRSQ